MKVTHTTRPDGEPVVIIQADLAEVRETLEAQKQAELAALRARVAELEAALRPFADWWTEHVDTPYNRYMSPGAPYPSHDDLRRAAALLAASTHDDEGAR